MLVYLLGLLDTVWTIENVRTSRSTKADQRLCSYDENAFSKKSAVFFI